MKKLNKPSGISASALMKKLNKILRNFCQCTNEEIKENSPEFQPAY